MTGDGTHTYQWDAEDRMVSVDGGSTATQKYNSLGQRVERFLPNGSWTFDYPFGLNGEDLGTYSAGTAAWFDENVPMAGRVLVMYGSPSRFLHENNLGTTTVTTDQTGAELQDELFYPWGQDWTRAGQPYVMHFAGMQGFENPGLVYPTDFRRYNPALGRWMSPDPAGMAASDPSNPRVAHTFRILECMRRVGDVEWRDATAEALLRREPSSLFNPQHVSAGSAV
jgi:RHS repeat-associated protein